MSENGKKKKKNEENKPEDVPIGTGLAANARDILLKRRKREREMRQRFNINK